MHYDERFQQILEVGARVFASKGFHHASMRDLSKASGMSLAGLYYYFKSKDELLYLIQKDIFETVMDSLHQRLEKITDPVEQLETLIDLHINYFATQMDRVKVLSHESDSLVGTYWQEIRDLKRKYYRLVKGIILKAQEKGQVGEVNPHVATMALFGMMNWIYTWYRSGEPATPPEIAKQMSQIYLKGLLTR